MVIDVRQIGKTYLIDEFCNNEFKDYICVNLMKAPNIVRIFEENINFEDKVKKIELERNKNITE